MFSAVLFTILFGMSGDLAGESQIITDLPTDQKVGSTLTLKVKGDGSGDIDCYVLIHGRIVSRDEGSADECEVSFTRTDDQPAKLWIRNNDKNYTHYRIVDATIVEVLNQSK